MSARPDDAGGQHHVLDLLDGQTRLDLDGQGDAPTDGVERCAQARKAGGTPQEAAKSAPSGVVDEALAQDAEAGPDE